jgi:hypothetical protein
MARGSTDRTILATFPEFASEHSDKMKSLSLTCLQSTRCANKLRESSTGQKGQTVRREAVGMSATGPKLPRRPAAVVSAVRGEAAALKP